MAGTLAVCRGWVMQPKMPCFVITKDRPTYTKQLLDSLQPHEDQFEIIIMDHGSSYPIMLHFLEYLEKYNYKVFRLGLRSPRQLWESSIFHQLAGDGYYAVTDPDLVFKIKGTNWINIAKYALQEDPSLVKVGPGLVIDDLPNTSLSHRVRNWEAQYWVRKHQYGHMGDIDTTMALYRPLTEMPEFRLGPAVRLDEPFLMRHLPWYQEYETDELIHYRNTMVEGSSFWSVS